MPDGREARATFVPCGERHKDGYHAHSCLLCEMTDYAVRATLVEAGRDGLRKALIFVLHHGPCPCGAWQDRLSERPHAPGCRVALALEDRNARALTGHRDHDRLLKSVRAGLRSQKGQAAKALDQLDDLIEELFHKPSAQEKREAARYRRDHEWDGYDYLS